MKGVAKVTRESRRFVPSEARIKQEIAVVGVKLKNSPPPPPPLLSPLNTIPTLRALSSRAPRARKKHRFSDIDVSRSFKLAYARARVCFFELVYARMHALNKAMQTQSLGVAKR